MWKMYMQRPGSSCPEGPSGVGSRAGAFSSFVSFPWSKSGLHAGFCHRTITWPHGNFEWIRKRCYLWVEWVECGLDFSICLLPCAQPVNNLFNHMQCPCKAFSLEQAFWGELPLTKYTSLMDKSKSPTEYFLLRSHHHRDPDTYVIMNSECILS